MNVTDKGRFYLTSILKWAKFFYITYIISLAIILLVGLIMVIGGIVSLDTEGATLLIGGITYLLLGGVLVWPVIYMKKAIDFTKKALETDNDTDFEHALLYTKSLCKFYGIYLIVVLALVLMAVLIGIVAGLLGIVL